MIWFFWLPVSVGEFLTLVQLVVVPMLLLLFCMQLRISWLLLYMLCCWICCIMALVSRLVLVTLAFWSMKFKLFCTELKSWGWLKADGLPWVFSSWLIFKEFSRSWRVISVIFFYWFLFVICCFTLTKIDLSEINCNAFFQKKLIIYTVLNRTRWYQLILDKFTQYFLKISKMTKIRFLIQCEFISNQPIFLKNFKKYIFLNFLNFLKWYPINTYWLIWHKFVLNYQTLIWS